ncbi:hydrogenase expression protein HypF [Streptomyces sp. NPDC001070]
MRGDEVQPASTGIAAGSGTRERTGPRHAAPRKSLLTKLQMPAGKAIALAAMPTAVLMGMGLTPRLASADELPKNPFSGTKCVEQPDEPSESATPSTPSGGGTKTATPSPSASSSSHDTSSGSGSGDQGGNGDDTGGGSSGSTSGGSATTAPAPSASATKQTNPLDPLGVGDALGDLLGLNKSSEPSAAATPSASATPAPGATSAAPKPSATKGTVGKTVEDTTDTVKKAVSEATKAASETTAKATESPAVSADGKTPFPCPTHDAQALADAAYQETQSLLPDDPWVLHSSLLTLTGLDYKGIVEVKTWSGKVKKVLKFTASGVDIKDLQQEVVGPNGTVGHVDARKGSTSTIRNGTVTMYTESLKGNLFGLIPIEFTPDTPPPLNVPAAFFTNVTVKQAAQFGGTLKVPGMHVYNTAD